MCVWRVDVRVTHSVRYVQCAKRRKNKVHDDDDDEKKEQPKKKLASILPTLT